MSSNDEADYGGPDGADDEPEASDREELDAETFFGRYIAST